MLQDKISQTGSAPKTIQWLDALSQSDISRMLAFAKSNIIPIRKETHELLENMEQGLGYEPSDRVTMGKIQTDLRKFLALMAFADQLPQAVHTNFWMLKAMRSRIKKAGKFAKVGFEWEIYDTEAKAFRNKAEKEGEWGMVADADSDYLAFKSEGERWVAGDEKIAQHRNQSLDNHYLLTRLRILCISLSNAKIMGEKANKQQKNNLLNEALTLLEFGKKLPHRKPPNLQFYIDYGEYLASRIRSATVEPPKVKAMFSLIDHPAFLPDPIAYAFAYSIVLAALVEGRSEYYRAGFDFLRRGIETGKLRDLKKRIPLAYYRTLTQSGLLAQKEKDLKPLLSIWKDELAAPHQKQEALFKHCLAMVHLKEEKYNRAWKTSQEVQFTQPNFLWFNAELQFKILFEAETVGQPIQSEKHKGWEDTREDLIAEMVKYSTQLKGSRYHTQGERMLAKTEMYRVLETENLHPQAKRRKIKELAEKSDLNQLDIEWFAKMTKSETEFIRPRT